MKLVFLYGPFDGLEIEEQTAPDEFRLPKPTRIQHAGGITGRWGEGVASPGAIEFFSAPPLVVVYRRKALISDPESLWAPGTAIYEHVPEVKL